MHTDIIILSVIIPVYNVKDYLLKCLLSVINQSDDRVQVILVDDGSTDDSISSVERIVARHRNIEVYNKNNGGLSSARNYGMNNAKGKYIYFADSDDFICDGVLAAILDKLKISNENCFVFKHITTSQLSGSNYEHIHNNQFKKVGVSEYLKHYSSPITNVWKMIVSRDFLINNNIIFREGVLCEDIEWLSKVLLSAESVIVSDIILYVYNNQREDSIMNVLTAKRIADTASNIKITKDMIDPVRDDEKRKAFKKLLFVEWCVNLSYYSRLKKSQRKSVVLEDSFLHDSDIFIFKIYGFLIKILTLDIMAGFLYVYKIIRAFAVRCFRAQ